MAIANPLPTNAASVWRAVWAVVAGTLAIIVLSVATDEILRVAHVMPPADRPLPTPGLYALALGYRCAYNVIGALVTARLAPGRPFRPLLAPALVGLVLGTAGVVVNFRGHLGPAWYPVLLALSAIPCTWIGARIHAVRARHPGQ
jgi:hypothetical protein